MGRTKDPGILKRGRTWYVRIQRNGRDLWRAAGPTRQEALELRARLLQELARERAGLPVPPKGSRVLFREVVPDFLSWAKTAKRSADRDELSIKHLVGFFGDRPITDITPRLVEDYRAARRSEVSCRGGPPTIGTLNREVRCLTRIMRFAVDRGLLPTSPLARLRLPSEAPPRVPTVDLETQARILAALPPWARLPVEFAFGTGARAGEICAARWRDLDLSAGTWTIPDSKNLAPRVVPLSSRLIEVLRPLQGTPEAPLFTCEGRTLQVTSLSHAFKNAVRRVGRPDLRLHDCRHAFASAMLATGASLVEIAALLGHRTLTMAARYSHASPARLRALVEAIPSPTPATPALVVTLAREARDDR